MFPTISLAEQFVVPTTMLLRNLMAMDVEEMIRSSPIDGVVLLAGCDKTVPAQLMGAAERGEAGHHDHRRSTQLALASVEGQSSPKTSGRWPGNAWRDDSMIRNGANWKGPSSQAWASAM